MTKEQEKATELINKYYDELGKINGIYIGITKQSKQCALIAVDEIIIVLEKLRKPEYTTFIEWEQLKTKDEADTMDGYEYLEYWEKVKEEIKKL